MALPQPAQEATEQSLLDNGYYCWEDASAGNRVAEMERKGFPYYSDYGMDFCADFAFDPRILSILESSLPSCVLGHWLRYGENAGHIECLRRGGREAGRRVFVVQVWSKGSQVDYYGASHLHNLATTRGLRSIFEVASSELDRVGCEPNHKSFPDGALVIADARIAFEIKRGYAITFLFATEEVVARWAKIIIPRSAALADKIASIESKSANIRFNFEVSDTQ